MTDNLPRLLTEEEAAAYLGVHPRTLARLRQAGKIRHLPVASRRYRYLEDYLIAFIAATGKGPPVPEPSLKSAPNESGHHPARELFRRGAKRI